MARLSKPNKFLEDKAQIPSMVLYRDVSIERGLMDFLATQPPRKLSVMTRTLFLLGFQKLCEKHQQNPCEMTKEGMSEMNSFALLDLEEVEANYEKNPVNLAQRMGKVEKPQEQPEIKSEPAPAPVAEKEVAKVDSSDDDLDFLSKPTSVKAASQIQSINGF